jgi:ribosomal protein S3
MGQKVNPLLIRRAISNPNVSSWFSSPKVSSHLISQDLEIREFLTFFLQSRGMHPRSCNLIRSGNGISLDVDLYFSFALSKRVKFQWAKRFFQSLKKKYTTLNRIKDLKIFLEKIQTGETFISTSQSLLKQKVDDSVSSNFSIDYSKRVAFLCLMKEKKQQGYKKNKMSFLCMSKRALVPKFVRVRLPKLLKLFRLTKWRYRFNRFFFNKQQNQYNRYKNSDLHALSKSMAKTLQHFSGIEKINIRLFSTQLSFLPTLKLYHRFIVKELQTFYRNKNINRYFFETVELFYFVLGTFCYGNAFLLAKTIAYLLENTRKQMFVVRFIKKVLTILFNKLPLSFFAIAGIKILIKGRFNKRRRTKTIVIQEGQVSLQTLDIPIDYYQTKAVTLYGSFGIKVWLAKKIT